MNFTILRPFGHRAGPVAEQSRAEPSRAGPRRAEPSWAGLGRAEPSRAEPSRAEPGRAGPSRAEPSRAEGRVGLMFPNFFAHRTWDVFLFIFYNKIIIRRAGHCHIYNLYQSQGS